ncbi:MAG: cyclic nucleotide-binding domain-containing protein [Deltaproteobacteria bacterium]|nr:cyclic nucleotide-binding domain-containing protein [Deltaproteobacteria bacterium]
MELIKKTQGGLDVYRDKLLLILQGLTALAMVMTVILMIHVGPLTLFLFMTAAQGLLLLSIVLCTILLVTQRKAVQKEHYGPGQVIFRKGDKGERLYIIMHGEVEIVDEEPGKEGRIIGKLGPGECFGEWELVTNRSRMATIRSRTGVNLMSMGRESFDAMFAHLPPIRSLFEKLIEERAESQRKAREG